MAQLRLATLEDGRKAIIIRTSDRLAFKKCRRSWAWSSHLKRNLGSRYLPLPLWFGSAIHYALEDYHGYNYFGRPSRAFAAYCIATSKQHNRDLPDDAQEGYDLGIAMMDYYVDYWLRFRNATPTYWALPAGYTGPGHADPKVVAGGYGPLLPGGQPNPDFHDAWIPQVEVNFSIEIPLDQFPVIAEYAKRQGADCVLYRGTIDRVGIEEMGSLTCVEYKTAKRVENFHFQTDPQITTYCTPKSTEILTRRGWKKYDQLVIGEQVMGFNEATGKQEWTILEAIHTPGVQAINRISNKSFQFYATPDHRWVRGIKQKGASYKNNPKTRIHTASLDGYKDNSYMILSAPYEQGDSKLTPDEAQILGWLLTDGTWGTYDRGDRASISQKKFKQDVHELLMKFPGCFTRITENEGTETWHLAFPFVRELFQKARLNWDMSNWEEFVLGMSWETLHGFLMASMMGDGGSNGSFFQNKGPKQDLFRLAFFLAGKFPTAERTTCKDNGWSLNTEGNTFTVGTPHKWMKCVDIQPAGEADVWCPQTKLGTWVMRQGSQIAITGNCWAMSNIYTRPVGSVTYYQFVKNEPKLPRTLASGKISTAANLVSSGPLYRKALENMYGRDETRWPVDNKNKLHEIMLPETEHKDRFVQRDIVRRNEHSILAEAEKIVLEVEDMINPDLPLYSNPTRDGCKFCSFSGACVTMDDGGDWEFELLNDYSERDQAPDRMWRRRIPSVETMLQLMERKESPDLIGIQSVIRDMNEMDRARIEAGEDTMNVPTFKW